MNSILYFKPYSIILYIFTTSLFSLVLSAQTDSTDHSYLRMKIENDFLSLGNWSDRYFTNGLRIEYQSPERWKLKGLKKLYPLLPGKSSKKLKLSAIFQMSMFTPLDITKTEIQYGDRPYAGLAYFALGGISNDFPTGSRLTTEYGIGMIGPATRQGQLQKSWHQWLIDHGRKTEILPNGWHNQIANALAINIRTEYERILFSPVENIETIGGFEVNFGTITNYVGLNANLRVGKFNDYFYNSSGLKMRNKSPSFEKFPARRPFYPNNINRKWQYYFFAKPSFRFALNNSLLQGGLFAFSKNPYTVPSDQLNRFYVNVEFGYGLVFNRTGLLFLQQFRSKEFITAQSTTWGTIYLMFGFGGK